jgi:hypothetical protein
MKIVDDCASTILKAVLDHSVCKRCRVGAIRQTSTEPAVVDLSEHILYIGRVPGNKGI